MFDVAIIGAGPAGAVAATTLARRRWRVALIEQHRFPRDKVCGECLSALGIQVLDRLGLKDNIARLRPVRLDRTSLVAPNGRSATIELPRPMWGVSRSALDTELLNQARAAGAEILQPSRCEGTNPLLIRDLITNDRREIPAQYTLIADGKAACGVAHPRPTKDLGLKAHFANVEDSRDTISLFGLCGHYVGLAAIENGHWNLAMSVPAARVKSFAGDFDALFAQCCRESVALADRFSRAVRTTDWLAAPLPRFPVSSRWPSNTIPLGNAAAALEPIGGEGMGLAMRSAELVAEAVDVGLRGKRDVNVSALQTEFNRLWSTRRIAARATAMMMSCPLGAKLVVGAINACKPLARPALIPLGKF